MHIYDQYGWIVHNLSLLILIYAGIQCLLAYSISDFEETAKKYNHVAFYESGYLINYIFNYFFQNSYLDVR